MHFRRRIALVTGATAILASLVAAPVFAADSSGWHTNSLALTTSSVDGCKVQWWGYVDSAHTNEYSYCSGNIGLQIRYKLYSGSLTYTSNVDWGYSYVDVGAPIVLQSNTHH